MLGPGVPEPARLGRTRPLPSFEAASALWSAAVAAEGRQGLVAASNRAEASKWESGRRPQSSRSGFAVPPPRVLLVSPAAVPLPSDAWPVGARLFHAAEIGLTRFPLFGRDQQNIVLDRRGRAYRPEVEQLHA